MGFVAVAVEISLILLLTAFRGVQCYDMLGLSLYICFFAISLTLIEIKMLITVKKWFRELSIKIFFWNSEKWMHGYSKPRFVGFSASLNNETNIKNQRTQILLCFLSLIGVVVLTKCA